MSHGGLELLIRRSARPRKGYTAVEAAATGTQGFFSSMRLNVLLEGRMPPAAWMPPAVGPAFFGLLTPGSSQGKRSGRLSLLS